MTKLYWHHVHVTVSDRVAAASWHDQHTPAKRVRPTKRSENLIDGPNLLQFQSKAVVTNPRKGCKISIGIAVSNLNKAVDNWQATGGSINTHKNHIARVLDPWGIPFELVEYSQIGYSHINFATESPELMRDWYELNLGGRRVICEWDDSRLALAYDTILIVFEPRLLAPSSNEMIIDHLGWYIDDLDSKFNQLSSKGVSFPVKPMVFGIIRLAHAMDPCGTWIELNESKEGIEWKKSFQKNIN
ncbi:MAG: VOC family protein [Candidatus Thorarchaeota archaeon]